jgi:hypothetical protein
MSTNDRNDDLDTPDDASEAGAPEVVPLPEGRSQALAAMCERLLKELDGDEVTAAEIRFIVQKPEPPQGAEPGQRPDPGWAAEVENGELLYELRRLIASSAGTIAEAAHALESRAVDVDDQARDLLRDEVQALDVDLAVLKSLLADAVDWDRECERLLAGETPPADDPVVEEDDETDD